MPYLYELRKLSHIAHAIGEPSISKGTMLVICTMASWAVFGGAAYVMVSV